jgi:hypothetical protein
VEANVTVQISNKELRKLLLNECITIVKSNIRIVQKQMDEQVELLNKYTEELYDLERDSESLSVCAP